MKHKIEIASIVLATVVAVTILVGHTGAGRGIYRVARDRLVDCYIDFRDDIEDSYIGLQYVLASGELNV